jgi:hypothetical protein
LKQELPILCHARATDAPQYSAPKQNALSQEILCDAILPQYPESTMAISSSFRDETNACQVNVILLLPAQDGP